MENVEMEIPLEKLKKLGNGDWDVENWQFSPYSQENPAPESLLFVFWIEGNEFYYKVYDAREGRAGNPICESEGEEALATFVDVVVTFLEGGENGN